MNAPMKAIFEQMAVAAKSIEPLRRKRLDPDHQGYIAPQGEAGGYHACWYPVMLSSEVEPGEVKSTEFLDGQVIVYRGESGTAYVRSAFCRHMGAHLGLGTVMDEDVRCPFHHWRYGSDGRCSAIPAGDAIPRNARLFAFPTAEKWGLIWAFNGEEPLYDLPYFDVEDNEGLIYKTKSNYVIPQDHWVLLSNSCDFQHLEALHGVKVHTKPKDIHQPDPYHLEGPIDFEDPETGRTKQMMRDFGTCCLTLTGVLNGVTVCTMAAMKPLPGNRTLFYTVTAVPRPADGSEEAMHQAQGMLHAFEAFFDRLADEDTPIMKTARFKQDLVTASDWALVKYLSFVRNFPRAHPSATFIA